MYKRVYVFGDSFCDTGNLFNATAGAIPPNHVYFNGRFSNGPVWVEYLAVALGLSFNSLTNFAFGGATTGVNNISLAQLPGLQQQLNIFKAANHVATPDALYIIWAGANDYFSYFSGRVLKPTQAIANLSVAVESLAAIGAKDIMVVNQLDLGKFPVARFDSHIPSYFSSLTIAHNSCLVKALNFLSKQLTSNINIIPMDVNSLFGKIIAEPKKFGFTNVTDYCIKDLSVVPLELPTEPVASNPDKFLFWDPVHLTTVTHKLIGELAFSALNGALVL
jgi:phospholipase/lecithinase/hemolysin